MPPGTINYTAIQPPGTDSDGRDSLYPANLQGAPAATPDNFFREVQPHERKHVLYRTECAKQIIETFHSGEVDQSNKYILESFPEHYKLYEHNKRQANGKFRTDHYLFGHPTGQRFRSVPEYIPHILYLAAKNDPALANHPASKDFQVCKCAYCGRKTAGTPRASGGSSAVSSKATETAKARKLFSVEERLGEREMAGWVFRKGEIVWVWIGDDEEELDLTLNEDWASWAAGAVVQKPAVNTALRTASSGGGAFASMDIDGPAPWEEGQDDWYTIQLLSENPSASDVLTKVKQWRLRPWLCRSSSHHPKEHRSVTIARTAVQSFSLFEPLETIPASEGHPYPRETWGGVFLGAEKVFVNEPVRIRHPSNEDLEDVMVVSHIYSETKPSANVEGKTTTVTMLRGNIYTTHPGFSSKEITPQQFADLPFRMRRGAADGSTITWHTRNGPSERGELAIKHVLGRWYEPVAVHHWGGVSERCHLKHMAKNRAETPGFRGIYSSQDPADAVDGKTPRKAMLASPGGSNASNSKQRGITPERGFKSVNAPGSITKSKMALAVEGDDEEDDGSDVEEIEVDPAVFGKSPTKRLAFRQTSLDK